MRRAASSVPANIAESSARETRRNHLHWVFTEANEVNEGSAGSSLPSFPSVRSQGFDLLVVDGGTERRNVVPVAGGNRQFASETKRVFACLHGLIIKAVESESGKLTRILAMLTSACALLLTRSLPSA